MTVAVCLKCGALKHGALTPCPGCSHDPREPEDQARHLMTSDHYFSHEALAAIGARVKRGEPLTFDAAQVQSFVTTIQSSGGGRVGFYLFAILALGAAVVGAVIYLLRRLAT
jgi:hypothetical protein